MPLERAGNRGALTRLAPLRLYAFGMGSPCLI